MLLSNDKAEALSQLLAALCQRVAVVHVTCQPLLNPTISCPFPQCRALNVAESQRHRHRSILSQTAIPQQLIGLQDYRAGQCWCFQKGLLR